MLPELGRVLRLVLVLGQGHGDAHPYILQICTVASLTSPLRGSRNVFAIELRQSQ